MGELTKERRDELRRGAGVKVGEFNALLDAADALDREREAARLLTDIVDTKLSPEDATVVVMSRAAWDAATQWVAEHRARAVGATRGAM